MVEWGLCSLNKVLQRDVTIVLTQDPSSEERFHVELHFSPGVKVSEEESAPMGFGFRPASAEVYTLSFVLGCHHVLD